MYSRPTPKIVLWEDWKKNHFGQCGLEIWAKSKKMVSRIFCPFDICFSKSMSYGYYLMYICMEYECIYSAQNIKRTFQKLNITQLWTIWRSNFDQNSNYCLPKSKIQILTLWNSQNWNLENFECPRFIKFKILPLQIGSKLYIRLLQIGMTRFEAMYVFVKWTIDFPFRSVNRSAGEDLLEQRASITRYKEATEMQKGFLLIQHHEDQTSSKHFFWNLFKACHLVLNWWSLQFVNQL